MWQTGKASDVYSTCPKPPYVMATANRGVDHNRPGSIRTYFFVRISVHEVYVLPRKDEKSLRMTEVDVGPTIMETHTEIDVELFFIRSGSTP